jgi:hypothetical protein
MYQPESISAMIPRLLSPFLEGVANSWQVHLMNQAHTRSTNIVSELGLKRRARVREREREDMKPGAVTWTHLRSLQNCC